MSHTRFTPGPETTRDFRTALGHFPTGVTVVTTQTANGPLGITANSFASVSLDPPLVLWCPAKISRRYQAFCDAPLFNIHVLGLEQQDIARRFASKSLGFDGLEFGLDEAGQPLIPDCLATFHCTRFAVHDAGDHAVIIGQVTSASYREGPALVFHAGDFRA